MKLSKKDLTFKIARARKIANECMELYGGSKYPFLVGAYEALFSELLGIENFDDYFKKVGK